MNQTKRLKQEISCFVTLTLLINASESQINIICCHMYTSPRGITLLIYVRSYFVQAGSFMYKYLVTCLIEMLIFRKFYSNNLCIMLHNTLTLPVGVKKE